MKYRKIYTFVIYFSFFCKLNLESFLNRLILFKTLVKMDAKKLICVNEVLKDIYYKYISVLNPEKKKKIQVVEFIEKELIPLMSKKEKKNPCLVENFIVRVKFKATEIEIEIGQNLQIEFCFNTCDHGNIPEY